MALTVAELIQITLRRVYTEHYERTRKHEFPRDYRALTKAIARYGYECDQRGWSFDPDAIWRELMQVLDTMRGRDPEIRTWFPIYLEHAVDRHLRLRADELSAEAKRESRTAMPHARARTAGSLAAAVGAGLAVADVRTPTAVEQLATLYKDLSQRARRRRSQRPAGKPTQLTLI